MSADDDSRWVHEVYSVDKKLDGIKATYVASQYMTVSKPIKDLIEKTSGLEHALVKGHCSIYTLYQYCFKDQMFGAAIFDDHILSNVIRKLKDPNASNLFNEEIILNDEETRALNVPDAIRNEFGSALLRMVAPAFRDRLELFKLTLSFWKGIFDFVKADDELFGQHKHKLMHHLLRLEAEVVQFSTQLPKVPPEAGDFDELSEMLSLLAGELNGFFHTVDAALDSLKAKATL
jgi:hypothetical protein